MLHKEACLIFGLFPFQINYFCIMFSLLIISVRTLVTREIYIISDITKVLKVVVLPSAVKFLIIHNFSTFSIFWTCLIWKCIPKIFIVFLVKPIQSILQNASDTPFRASIPAISHFALIGLKPERSKNLSKLLITPITESPPPTENVVL